MGQPKLRPDAALRGKFPAGVLENPEPIAERFAHSTDSRPAALRPAQPPPQRPATPVAATEAPPAGFARVRARWSANRRLLIVASILALLVPAVIFAAVWLSLGDPAEPPAPAPPQEAESKPPAAVLTSAGRIEAIGGSGVAFPIALDGTDGVPSRSVIAIKGLPHGSNVSEGRPYGDSEWTLRPDQIGDLSLTMPAAAQGEFKCHCTDRARRPSHCRNRNVACRAVRSRRTAGASRARGGERPHSARRRGRASGARSGRQ